MEFGFLVTNTSEGWKRWSENNTEVTISGVTIRKDPTYIYQKLAISLKDRVSRDFSDMALDECGILYFLEAGKGDIYRFDPVQNIFERIFSLRGTNGDDGSLQFRDPQGILVTRNNIYVIDTGNKRLHCISKHLLQTRWILAGDIFSQAVDLVVDRQENIFVLDRGSQNIIKVTKGGVVSESFGKEQLENSLDITIDIFQRIYVLDKAGDEYRIWRFMEVDGRYAFREPEKYLITSISPGCIVIGGEDEIFIGEEFDTEEKEPGKTLYKYLPANGSMVPILSYRGSADKLVSDPGKNLYVLSGNKRDVYFLKLSKRNTVREGGHPYRANLYTRHDSKRNDTLWHRMKLDFELSGPGTQVRVWYYATDNDDLTYENIDTWSSFSPNPGDALFDADISRGRYLWINLELIGSEFDSPKIKSLRLYYPRISYLRYLPAIYQEDESSRKLLERFLSIFESFFVDIEENIDRITRYFDPDGIPAEYISWLGSWLGLDIDETWTERKKRDLISRAPELYRMRGTRQGLMAILGLYLSDIPGTKQTWNKACSLEKNVLDMLVDTCYLTEEDKKDEWKEFLNNKEERIKTSQNLLGIMEYFQLDVIEDDKLKEIYANLIGGPYCFVVLVYRSSINDEELRSIQRIVDSEKPAHTVGKVIDLQPWIRLGEHSYLGVNTVLSEPRFILERSGLGWDTVVTEREEYGHFDLRSRIGVDTKIS
ncbi:MAG: phage tail protein [ANME-2 cluster archaeon]|nr:phage tail protein [ANME-2 cluster archaeon]